MDPAAIRNLLGFFFFWLCRVFVAVQALLTVHGLLIAVAFLVAAPRL